MKSFKHHEAYGRRHARNVGMRPSSLEGAYSSEAEGRSEDARVRSIEEALRSMDFRGEQKSASSPDKPRKEIEDKLGQRAHGTDRTRFATATPEYSETSKVWYGQMQHSLPRTATSQAIVHK
jgi:hypothetical protein